MACADDKVLAWMKYGGDFDGIMTDDFDYAIKRSRIGILIVGPQEICAQVAGKFSQTIIFALKDQGMKLSPHLSSANSSGQLHRLNINVLKPGAWSRVYRDMKKVLDPGRSIKA